MTGTGAPGKAQRGTEGRIFTPTSLHYTTLAHTGVRFTCPGRQAEGQEHGLQWGEERRQDPQNPHWGHCPGSATGRTEQAGPMPNGVSIALCCVQAMSAAGCPLQVPSVQSSPGRGPGANDPSQVDPHPHACSQSPTSRDIRTNVTTCPVYPVLGTSASDPRLPPRLAHLDHWDRPPGWTVSPCGLPCRRWDPCGRM